LNQNQLLNIITLHIILLIRDKCVNAQQKINMSNLNHTYKSIIKN